jgi:hypothetical protein
MNGMIFAVVRIGWRWSVRIDRTGAGFDFGYIGPLFWRYRNARRLADDLNRKVRA